MRKVVLLLLLVFSLTFVSGDVFHEMEVSDGKVELNTTVDLDCTGDNCPVNSWDLAWEKPGNAEILFVNDTFGEVEDYEVNDGSIDIQTNQGPAREEEVLKIGFRFDPDRKELKGLERIELQLPGFKDEKTSGVVRSSELVSFWVSPGFNVSKGNRSVSFSGEGPVNIRVNRGEGVETDFYEFFGESFEDADQAYRVASGVTGKVTKYGSVPVVSLGDERYNREFSNWSSGEYSRGVVVMRESLGNSTVPVLAHETVHAVNSRFLEWDETGTTYFDEATATYAEFLMKKKLFSMEKINVKPGTVFGKKREYVVEEGGKTVVYSVPPRGDADRLWNYYDSGHEWMKRWNVEDSGRRSFGYGYSQLMAMNHVYNDRDIPDVYRRLEVDGPVSSVDEKWRIFSEVMEMEPCNTDSRQEFDECIEEINSHDYSFVTAEPEFGGEEIEVERIELEKREVGSAELDLSHYFDKFSVFIKDLLSSLADGFN